MREFVRQEISQLYTSGTWLFFVVVLYDYFLSCARAEVSPAVLNNSPLIIDLALLKGKEIVNATSDKPMLNFTVMRPDPDCLTSELDNQAEFWYGNGCKMWLAIKKENLYAVDERSGVFTQGKWTNVFLWSNGIISFVAPDRKLLTQIKACKPELTVGKTVMDLRFVSSPKLKCEHFIVKFGPGVALYEPSADADDELMASLGIWLLIAVVVAMTFVCLLTAAYFYVKSKNSTVIVPTTLKKKKLIGIGDKPSQTVNRESRSTVLASSKANNAGESTVTMSSNGIYVVVKMPDAEYHISRITGNVYNAEEYDTELPTEEVKRLFVKNTVLRDAYKKYVHTKPPIITTSKQPQTTTSKKGESEVVKQDKHQASSVLPSKKEAFQSHGNLKPPQQQPSTPKPGTPKAKTALPKAKSPVRKAKRISKNKRYFDSEDAKMQTPTKASSEPISKEAFQSHGSLKAPQKQPSTPKPETPKPKTPLPKAKSPVLKAQSPLKELTAKDFFAEKVKDATAQTPAMAKHLPNCDTFDATTENEKMEMNAKLKEAAGKSHTAEATKVVKELFQVDELDALRRMREAALLLKLEGQQQQNSNKSVSNPNTVEQKSVQEASVHGTSVGKKKSKRTTEDNTIMELQK